MARKPKKYSRYSWLVALVAIAIWGLAQFLGGGENASVQAPEISANPDCSVLFIDVGQADATLIRCEGETMLIDGGNREDSDLIYTVLKKQGVEHLDYVVCTHAHEDHVGGLPGAFEGCSVDTVLCPVTEYDTRAFENFLEAVEEEGAEFTVPTAGDTFSLGRGVVQVVYCDPEHEEPNETSIVLRLVYGETAFLFAADAETGAEAVMLDSGYALQADVLKVGHHGSSTSSSEAFIDEVNPEYAIISCGEDNDYGHPHREIVAFFESLGIPMYRTDLLGDILVISDGKTITIEE